MEVVKILGTAAALAVLATGCVTGGPTIGPDYPALSSPTLTATPASGSIVGLTIHIGQPPSRGVDGGQEVIPLVQEACPGDTDEAGYRFSLRTKERTESSWTTVATCKDGSRHTVLIVWD